MQALVSRASISQLGRVASREERKLGGGEARAHNVE